ncbi:hypothetical protein BX616_006409 [Lobosporangium transversale]|uniref:RTA1 like protein-domain-containing protein n=1 Tax=Lobosporangium transversale TaxID=64571 RepID=A0A1Y2GBT8_9FUNG|nr:RTA1 like protein-domain-containing protein [Lobosporangium transversale]KAF9915323.1 hypothetical protein BX616_006409 [Lobosporangium transversale]ORZ06555.1 RTA1 like protein-domain-containing protein [Lobosporangium transversale]|eukprot:XP_021877598.1 RTA1 like protein-domain-containing protein [Lobosporangium transversale]
MFYLNRFTVITYALLLFLGHVQAQSVPNTPTPDTTPVTKRRGILKYEPSIPGNIIFGVCYLLLGITFSYHIHRQKDRWALCLPIGAFASALGFFIKTSLDPDSLKLIIYIVQNGLIVISPSAFLAFNFMLYGRFIAAVDPNFDTSGNSNPGSKGSSKMQKSRFSFIPPRIVGRTFIWSDLLSFLVQISAGGMQAGGAKGNSQLADIGSKLFLIGVTVQGVSYCLFTALLTVAVHRLIAERKQKGRQLAQTSLLQGKNYMGLDQHTAIVVGGLYFSSIFIIIRSIFRIVEFAEGYDGHLSSNEIYVFVLDAAPLVLAIGVFAFFWPTILLSKITTYTREVAFNHPMADSSRITPVHSNNNDLYTTDGAPLVR